MNPSKQYIIALVVMLSVDASIIHVWKVHPRTEVPRSEEESEAFVIRKKQAHCNVDNSNLWGPKTQLNAFSNGLRL